MPLITGFYDRADMMASPRTPTHHQHAAYELMYVFSGAMAMTAKDSSLVLNKRQYIFLDAEVPHQIGLKAPADSGMMNLEFTFAPCAASVPDAESIRRADPDYQYLMDHPAPFFVLTDEDETVYRLMKKTVLIAGSGAKDSAFLASLLTQQLLMRIARQLRVSESRRARRLSNPHVFKAIQYMTAHYAEPLPAAKTARALHIQPSYLHRLISRHTGETYGSLLRGLRMEKAKMLLAGSSLPVFRVAGLTGFSSPQYFAKRFREREGMSPAAYRKAQKE